MNKQVEVTWIMLRTIAYFTMVHAIFLELYIHFSLMYKTNNIFLVLPIKDLLNKDGDQTITFKLATGTKNLVSHLRVLFFTVVMRKSTAHVGTKVSDMRQQAQKGFHGVFVEIPQIKKGILCTYHAQGE